MAVGCSGPGSWAGRGPGCWGRLRRLSYLPAVAVGCSGPGSWAGRGPGCWGSLRRLSAAVVPVAGLAEVLAAGARRQGGC